ncbi:conserved hypothetical protein [Pantoea brenneri]|uniref:Uncharacterized protein n=1 Tax=Pantoea brenneri TaxID=472694 RepID=A0AAX3J3Y6_9GAMM|nr:hypothetical protein EP46_00930 [Pantoea sp. 3.5.1]VXB54222.1 conserved hypothetical protein [Pantoea brenneri]
MVADAHFSNCLTRLQLLIDNPSGSLFSQHGEILNYPMISQVMITAEIDNVYLMPAGNDY